MTGMSGGRTYLGCIDLRNRREIYQSGDLYIIEADNGKQVFITFVSGSNVRALYEALKGRCITVDGVVAEAERGAIQGLRLNSYGYKVRYEVQDISLVLGALGLATIEKQGRGYSYWIHPRKAG